MAENEQNAGAQTEEQQPEGQPTQKDTVPMSSYKKLQQDLQKTKDEVKRLAERAREGEPVEAALAREREERALVEKELRVERIKRTAPAELHDVIDNFVNKHGFVPDDEDLELLGSKVGKKPEQSTDSTATTSSGVRNSGLSGKKPNLDDDEYLKSINIQL